MKRGAVRAVDMLHGSIVKNLLLFALPLVGGNVLQLFYDAADVIVLGQFAGKGALASVGVTASAYHLVINVFLGLSTGAGVLVAQYFGGDRRKEVSQTVHTSAAVSLLIGVSVGALGFFLTPFLMNIIGTPADIFDGAVLYLRILFIGIPAVVVFNFGAAILRSVGDNRSPFVYLMISGILNVLLNLLFVAVFRLDILGVAVATILSQYLSAALCWLRLLRTHEYYYFSFREMQINAPILGRMVKIGIPSGLQMAMYSISNLIIQAAVNELGTDFVAATTAEGKIGDIVYVTMSAMVQAAMVFVGQCYGAGDIRRIHRLFWRSSGCIAAVTGLMTLVILPLSVPLLRIFNNDPEIIRLGCQRMRVLLPFYFLCGLYENAIGIIRGMGYSLMPMIGSVLGVCVVRIVWVYTCFAAYPTFSMLLYAYPASWIIAAVLEMVLYFYYYHKESAAGQPSSV